MRAPVLLTGHDDDVARWVAQRIPHVNEFGECVALGVGDEERGKLYAGVVFHDYQPAYRNIQLSMAADSPLWASRSVIRSILDYPFRQLGVWMVWTMTPLGNERALRVNEHVGFKRKPIVPHVFGPKKHAVICQMLAPDFARLYGDG